MEKNGGVVKGRYTEAIWNEIKAIPKLSKPEKIDLLERNVIGSMIGMLPPTEATLRGLFFDWVDESILWKVQGRLAEAIEKNNNRRGDKESYFKLAKRVMENDVIRSMTRRPAPDLIHRIATENGRIGNTYFESGDIIILSLTGAMQGLEEKSASNQEIRDVVFGGDRPKGPTNKGGNPHACPALQSAMGSIYGIIAALLNAGTIEAMPASLILEFKDWIKPEGNDKKEKNWLKEKVKATLKLLNKIPVQIAGCSSIP